MELFLFHVLMWGKSENSITVVAESLRLVERKELEECAFVLLQLDLELHSVLSTTNEGVDASVVLPDESLELCRSVSQL